MEREWQSSIWQRVASGDIKSVVYRLNSNLADLDSQDPFGRSGLHWAIDSNNYEIAELLLSKGCEIETKDIHNATAIDYLTLLRQNIFYDETEYSKWVSLFKQFRPELLVEEKLSLSPTFVSTCISKVEKNEERDNHVENRENSKFWFEQPVDIRSQREQENNSNNKEVTDDTLYRDPLQLPPSMSWEDPIAPTLFMKEDREYLSNPQIEDQQMRSFYAEVEKLLKTNEDEEGAISIFDGNEFLPSTQLFNRIISLSAAFSSLRYTPSSLNNDNAPKSNLKLNPGDLIGFIAASEFNVKIIDKLLQCAEIHSLVLHPNFRSLRLAPKLIKSIANKCTNSNVKQAIFTTVANLPVPLLTRTYHFYRILRIRTLKSSQFLKMNPFETNTQKVVQLKIDAPFDNGRFVVRKMVEDDAEKVRELINSYLSQFTIHQVFMNENQVLHRLLPQGDDERVYVVEDKESLDLCGFFKYHLMRANHYLVNEKTTLTSATMDYFAASDDKYLNDLFKAAFQKAHDDSADLFFCQNKMIKDEVMNYRVDENGQLVREENFFLTQLNFINSSAHMNYYLFNWKFAFIPPSALGLSFW